MIKVCRSCLAATLAALMLTVPIVAVDVPGNQAVGNERVITEIQLKLKPNAVLPEYIGSELKDPNDIFDNNSVKYAGGNDNAQGVLKDPKYQYVTNDKKEYSDKIFWPIKKSNNHYVFDDSKKLFLKFTFGVGEANGTTYKIDTRNTLPIKIGGRQFTIDATQLKEDPVGSYTVYLPLNAYRKVRFIPDGGIKELYLKDGNAQLNNQLDFDLDISKGEVAFNEILNKKFKFSCKDDHKFVGFFLKLPSGNMLYQDLHQRFAYADMDEMNNKPALKPLALKPLEVKLITGGVDNGQSTIPPVLVGKDKIINEGEKFDPYSLIDKLYEEAGKPETEVETVKNKITFIYDPANFDPDNPARGEYKILITFTREQGRTAMWTSTVIVRAKQKPPVPAPQPQPKPQEKTGNAYFDLGRYLLPTCPDSKCAKTETGAKKDDVPNTAAAVNN